MINNGFFTSLNYATKCLIIKFPIFIQFQQNFTQLKYVPNLYHYLDIIEVKVRDIIYIMKTLSRF
jgi:hypothetical protein